VAGSLALLEEVNASDVMRKDAEAVLFRAGARTMDFHKPEADNQLQSNTPAGIVEARIVPRLGRGHFDAPGPLRGCRGFSCLPQGLAARDLGKWSCAVPITQPCVFEILRQRDLCTGTRRWYTRIP
jgi:hypothetical protein